MADNEWLNKLKVGDEVGWHARYDILDVLKVTRITKTQIVTKYHKFNKKNGNMVGARPVGIYKMTHICELTEDFKIKRLHQNRRLRLEELLDGETFNKFSIADIERIIEILEYNKH